MPARVASLAESGTSATRRAKAIAGGASGSGGVQSLTRGLTLLEKLAESEGGITLTEISSRADLPPSTAHRLLNTLADMGFVTQAKRWTPRCRPVSTKPASCRRFLTQV